MPELVWDKVGDRVYETGLDKGVLYLPDGSAVPWNGLTSIVESFDKDTSPVYFDGMKISDLVVLGDFEASMKAITYPDEFLEVESLAKIREGLFLSDQPPKTFGLCYRTFIGNDVDGNDKAYKLHIIYNVTAIPKDKTYATLTTEPSLVEFEWEITAIPEEIPGMRPSAHIIIDSRDIDVTLLKELEKNLYGTEKTNASLIPMVDLVAMIRDFLRFEIIDNGDGTWTAVVASLEYLNLEDEGFFELLGINASYLDDDTFIVGNTRGVDDVPQIRIYDVGNGTWTATTEYDPIIVEIEPGMVNIYNANITVLNDDLYEISDTPED